MEKMWAPWRMKYVGVKTKGCIFCEKPVSNDDRKDFILTRTKYSFSLLNLYPYNNGHLMVAPLKHVDSLSKLSKDELLDLMNLVCGMEVLLKEVFNPEGFNMGLNLGKAAGAGFDAHIHFHIVPRWVGDTNFMPVISNVKVIPQSLDDLYVKLKRVIDSRRVKK